MAGEYVFVNTSDSMKAYMDFDGSLKQIYQYVDFEQDFTLFEEPY